MKTKYWVMLLGALLLISAVSGVLLLMPRADAAYAEITSHGKVIRTVDLSIPQSFAVETEEGSNTVTVQDGKIAVTAATCPDHYCMKRGFCASGAQIVCLPNRLVIRFTNDGGIDGMVG